MSARGLAALGLIAVAAPAARAACDEPLIGVTFGQPGLGATNVPLNTAVVFTFQGASPAIIAPHLTLFAPDGSIVDATVTELPAGGEHRHVFRLVPNQPLLPSTTYRAGHTVAYQCTAEPCTAPLAPSWQFTTGTATDVAAPTLPVPTVEIQREDVCADASCCGPFHALVTNLANPATGATRYDLYDDGALVESDAPFVIATDCARAGDQAYHPRRPAVALAPGVHHLTLRGYDLAQNEAIGTQVLDLDLKCPVVTAPDAGVPGADAGARADGDGDGGGCRAAHGDAQTAFLVAVGLLVTRRRSARARSRRGGRYGGKLPSSGTIESRAICAHNSCA